MSLAFAAGCSAIVRAIEATTLRIPEILVYMSGNLTGMHSQLTICNGGNVHLAIARGSLQLTANKDRDLGYYMATGHQLCCCQYVDFR